MNVMQASAEEAAAGPVLRTRPINRPMRRRKPAAPLASRVVPEIRNEYSIRDAGAAAATTMNGFPAIMDDLTANPPDTTGAVGPQHVVTTLNSRVQFQTRTGNVLGSMTLEKFWSPLSATDFVTDPRILYDPFAKRWLASAITVGDVATSAVLVGASQTADPTGNWTLFRVPVDSEHQLTGDYDVMGFNASWVAVSIDVYKGPEYRQSNLYLFAKAELYGGKATFRKFGNFYGPFVPVTDYDNLAKKMYLLQEDFG